MTREMIKNVNRRQFLGGAAKTVGAILAFPTFITTNALGGRGGVPASDRINFGAIALGSRGSTDLRAFKSYDDVVFVANCDVRRTQRETIKRTIDTQYNSDIQSYYDFRELLERKDIDAVLSASSDRNHALIAIYAMRAGKDIYSEKPGSMTIEQGQKLVNTQKRTGRIYQGGAQRMSENNFIFANELVRLGKLGEVKTVVAELATMGGSPYMTNNYREEQPLPPKEEFWWDGWLGACPWRPFNASTSRNDFDFYCSNIGEWGSHTHPQAMDAIGVNNTGPVEVKYVDNNTAEGMTFLFPNGKEMVIRQRLQPSQCAVQYEGSEGWVGVGDNGREVRPQSLMSEYNKIVTDYRERTGRRGDHVRDLLDCIRSRRQTTTPTEVVHRSMSTVHIGNICMWLKRDLKFDPVKEEFVNDDAANRLRSRAEREPWVM